MKNMDNSMPINAAPIEKSSESFGDGDHEYIPEDENVDTTDPDYYGVLNSTLFDYQLPSEMSKSGWTTNPVRAPYGYFWLIVGIFGALLNLLVILMATSLLSYTFADLFFCIFNAPTYFCLYSVAESCDYQLAQWIKHFSRWVASISGNYSLMLITLDKLLYIVHPLRYDSFINLRQATAIALSVWLFSTLVAFINKFAPWAHTTWYWSLEKSITLILPIGVSIAVSIYLLILVVGKHRGGTTSVYPHIKPPSWKKRSRTVVFIFATTFWTVACLLPNMIVWGIANDTFNWWTIEWHEHLYAVTRMWAYFDHVGNPLITIFVNVFYRKLMINFILNVGRHMRTEVDSESSRSNNNVVAGHEETKV